MHRKIPSRFAFVGGLSAFVAGLLVWRVLFGLARELRGVPSGSLQEARELGLISFTVLHNYDLGQEGLAWLMGCILVPLSLWAVLASLLPAPAGLSRAGRRRRGGDRRGGDDRRESERDEEDSELDGRRSEDRRGPPAWFPGLGLSVTCLAVAFRPSFWAGPSPWGSFGLLGEEGVYLGAVQALRDGRLLYSELEFPYGPLLIEPLTWWLAIFPDSVVSVRVYAALLTGLGLAVAGLTLRALIGSSRGGWLGLCAALALALLAPTFLPTLNSVLLRTTLPFLPAALVLAGARGLNYRESEGGPLLAPLSRCPFAAAGLSAGIAVFFAFDTGAAAVFGLGLALVLVGGGAAVVGRALLPLVVVCSGIGTAMLIEGNLGGFIQQALRMLHLPAIGYQALPYPDAFGLFVDSAGHIGGYPPTNPATDTWSNATALWSVLPPLLIWLGLGLGLHGPRAGGHATRNAALLCTAAISAVLFRAALGRSDLYHLWFYGSVPVVLISLQLLDRAWSVATNELRAVLTLVTLGGVAALLSLGTEEEVRFPESEEIRLAEIRGIGGDPLEVRTVDHPRTGSLQVLPRLAVQLEVTLHRAAEIPDHDGVYFFPSEAAFYFLTDRPVPLRYLWAYDAATPAMQRLAIDDLEASRPRWLFRSTDTFSIDHIPQTHLLPLIDSYLKENYRLVEVLPGSTLHERKER